jgi:hypothetical protein
MESNKQVTAVEWFAEQLGIKSGDMLAKAKAMERKQIEEAYGHGQNNGYMYANQKAITIRKDQYYNETYKQKQ